MNNFFMKEALKEAKLAYQNGDVPVGAVVVYKNQIIARAHNQKEIDKVSINHAEILVLKQACEVLKDWRLNECTLYVTLEPCLMCAGAILQSRIQKLIYGASNEKFGYVGSIENILNDEKNNHKVIVEKNVCAEESKQLLQNFFKNKRS